jgi:hypothetical protein
MVPYRISFFNSFRRYFRGCLLPLAFDRQQASLKSIYSPTNFSNWKRFLIIDRKSYPISGLRIKQESGGRVKDREWE